MDIAHGNKQLIYHFWSRIQLMNCLDITLQSMNIIGITLQARHYATLT